MSLTAIRLLCNTSGSGKTRLLFEGLCQYWGFYIVAERADDDIGARDLEYMIASMGQSRGWTDKILNHSDEEARIRNENIALNRISKVLLARWVVFDTFIKVVKELNGGEVPDGARREWLLFQILPTIQVKDMDPFLAFISLCLNYVHYTDLRALLDQFTPSTVLGPAFRQPAFLHVLDEAQVAGEKYVGAFVDQAGKAPRPVLRPIILGLTSQSKFSTKMVVSGTGFSLSLFEKLVTSQVLKGESKWGNVVYMTGDFSDRNTQSAYISRYLPGSFLDSESGALLMTCMHEWLRGRCVALIQPR